MTRNVLRPALRVVITLALLASAAALWSLIPTKLQTWAPIVVKGAVGQRVTGRNLAVTVERTLLAREVAFVNSGQTAHIPSKGVWLIVVLSYEPFRQPETPAFELRAGGRRFVSNLSGMRNVQPGLPARGPVAFDIPEIPSAATLLVSNKVSDRYGYRLTAPLDSQIEVPLALPSGTPEATVNLNQLGD
ncbi:MAG TPA: hypothetical protein VH496_21625 [Mycobacterium sp.]|jgi:hypothetical protein